MIRLLLAVCALTLAAPAQDRRPNILFIMSDDHAAHALSCYGSAINRTPNLDRIAEQGMRFTNAFVTNSLCGPSRAVILTGKYSHVNGFSRNGDSFDPDQVTFPKLLRQAGYTTAVVGKWHLGTKPTGFDHWIVLPGQGAYHDPAFDTPDGQIRIEGHVSDVITDLALDWLENGRPKDRPFLLMYHHKAPHRRWQPAERHMKLFEGEEVPYPATFDDDWSHRASPAASTTMTIEHDLTRSDVKGTPPEGLTGQALKRWKYQRYIKDYLRCVAGVDEGVGRVLDYLDAHGLADNTIVVYTSDQGFFLGDHGWFDKRFMYEESLRTPLLVRWPGVVEPGSTTDAFALNLDFAETFLEAAGIPVPADMQGRSLVPVLRGETPDDWRTSIYYRYYEYPAVHDVRKHFGVRTARYKLIRFPESDEWELFDLADDPHELRSVYDDARYQDVVRRMKAELTRLQQRYGDDGTVRDPRLERFGPVDVVELGCWQPRVIAGAPAMHDTRGNDAPLEATVFVGRRDGVGMACDGEHGAVVPRTRDLDVAYVPFTLDACFRTSAPDGVVCAFGGGSHGASLWLDEGIPCFGIRTDGDLHVVRSDRPIPIGRVVRVTGALDPNRQLRLFVDGVAVGTAPGGVIRAFPYDPLSLGFDSGSAVVPDERAGLRGELYEVRLLRGFEAPR